VSLASEPGYKLKYDGGSVADMKAGKELRLLLDGSRIRLIDDGAEILSLPPSAITE
jgi:hypothetical protein